MIKSTFKNIYKKTRKRFKPYPRSKNGMKKLDKIILFIGLIGPFLAMPQLLKIWMGQDASGLSLITWSLWCIVDSIWIVYGFAYKIFPIVLSHTAYIAVQLGIVVGILVYGDNYFTFLSDF